MICHLSEVYATAAVKALLRIVAASDTEEATSPNLVTPTINSEVRGLCFWPLCLCPPYAHHGIHQKRNEVLGQLHWILSIVKFGWLDIVYPRLYNSISEDTHAWRRSLWMLS